MNLLTGQSQGMINPAEIGNQILLQLKKILKSLIILFIGSVLFCLFTGYLIDRTLSLLDEGSFRFTNSIILLLVLITVNLVVIVMALKKATAKEIPSVKETALQVNPAPTTSPLEAAIAALIFDFIKEREKSRTPPTES